MTNFPIFVKRAHSYGKISVTMELSVSNYPRGSIKTKVNTNITTETARALIADLTRLADESDAKVAAKKAADERRAKWQEREISAGRMRVMTAREVFGGR